MTNSDAYDLVDGFNRIAPRYDRVNDIMSFRLHRLWRRRLCRLAARSAPPSGSVLDVATGTGDVLLDLAARRPDLALHGIDPAREMLACARAKQTAGDVTVDFREGDGRKLPYADATFDVVTSAWGIRNMHPRAQALAEMHRVLKPGGVVLLLESGVPASGPLAAVYGAYAKLIPAIGARVAGYRPAYNYYVETVASFPSGPAFGPEMTAAGFTHATAKPLSFGAAYLYSGQRRAPSK